jgi:outer membrane protein assembly factor BamE
MRVKAILLSLLLASCSSFQLPLLSPYKQDIRQGNFVTPEMRAKLKIGMTRPQVLYVMGTPMIRDAFHADRWDYAYRLVHRGKVVESQDLTLYFKGENLVRIEGDVQTSQPAPAKDEAQTKG